MKHRKVVALEMEIRLEGPKEGGREAMKILKQVESKLSRWQFES
jgi:hypothetical protein